MMTAWSASAGPIFTQRIEISAPPIDVWEHLVTPLLVNSYYLAPMKTLDLREEGEIAYGTETETMISGKVKQVSPYETFAHTFRFGGGPAEDKAEPDTLVTYTIEEKNAGCVLTLTHSGFPTENQTYTDIRGGWPVILENLKQVIEAKRAPGAHGEPTGEATNPRP